MPKIDYIEIEGFKSIKKQEIMLSPINILIGANGAGKSNFISFFDFLQNLYKQNLEEYIELKGGTDKMLHKGKKQTNSLGAYLSFNDEVNGYSFRLTEGDGRLIFTSEQLWHHNDSWDMTSRSTKALIKTNSKGRGKYINEYLRSFRKYHFHDTSKNSPFTGTSNIENDQFLLYEEGGNLPAFLYGVLSDNPKIYHRIISTIQSIAPYFSDFYYPEGKKQNIRLQWQDKYSSTIYGATDLSDGTIRFIALATLFLQPNLPEVIVIDEPELGLHPVAIAKLAGLIKSASNSGTQVILATQSADLINHFEPEDIITVDQQNGESVFNRLDKEDLTNWLDDYTVGDLWQRNIINAGQPNV